MSNSYLVNLLDEFVLYVGWYLRRTRVNYDGKMEIRWKNLTSNTLTVMRGLIYHLILRICTIAKSEVKKEVHVVKRYKGNYWGVEDKTLRTHYLLKVFSVGS